MKYNKIIKCVQLLFILFHFTRSDVLQKRGPLQQSQVVCGLAGYIQHVKYCKRVLVLLPITDGIAKF